MKDIMSVQRSHFEDLNNRVAYLERVIRQLAERANMPEALEPPEGTSEWWAWSDEQATKDIEAGRTITLKTKEDIEQFFNNL
jgi:hypothetical protein